MSPPTWRCGLKHGFNLCNGRAVKSPPTWRCGLKQDKVVLNGLLKMVTSHVEVWIETG